jgi:hypothetical protein
LNARIDTSSIFHNHRAVLSPLTGSDDVELLAGINVAHLRAMWFDSFAVDVSGEFLGSIPSNSIGV